MKESVRAEQFLYVKHTLQYMNGHAVKIENSVSFSKDLFCLSFHNFSDSILKPGNTLEGDVSDVIALDQLTSPFSPRKATKMSP